MLRLVRRQLAAGCILVLSLTVAGCTALDMSATKSESPAVAAKDLLSGTRWCLAEIQSMDDAQGTTRPDNPMIYTLTFQRGGKIAMRLNCNRASGSWSAEPKSGAAGGNLRISPLAMTRASCPPPSIDARIARDMEFVRSYLLKEGRLYLNLMADGGIYVWDHDLGSD
jgi:heat shock protein HslJ